MNAPEILARLKTPADDGLVLPLKTLTPLYTGGIGQLGDQLHPSNLLGGIRHMSCLVARTLGDKHFEFEVWGNAGMGGNKAAAKQLALRWDTRGLARIHLPKEISIPRADKGPSRWWFNTGFEGALNLQISRRGVSAPHWQILMLALAIQLRHGSFAAKDQFGLGVLTQADSTRFCAPLDTAHEWPVAVPATAGQLNLLRYVFGHVRLRIAPGQQPRLNHTTALQIGLATRVALRHTLRAQTDAPLPEQARLTALRHRMLGQLNQFGSAVNVSAAYEHAGTVALRLAIALKSEESKERAEVFSAFRTGAGRLDELIETTGYRVDDIAWEFGGAHAKDKAAWLNKLAGV